MIGKLEYFIFNQLYERAATIVPAKEVKFLPTVSDFEKSWIALADLIFVIERFLISRVPVLKYTIVKSIHYDEFDLDNKVISNLTKLKKMLLTGDEKINNRSLNYLPPSSKSYFKCPYGTLSGRYNVDFINQFFGIKHFHITTDRQQDILLYYTVYQTQIFFLKIGKHVDIFKQDITQNLVDEFPDLIQHLGIAAMPDMPVTNHEYLPEDVKNIWLSGGNVSYVINNSYYTSYNPQTLTLLNSRAVKITSEIRYQAQYYFNGFTNQLKTLYPNITKDFEIEPLIFDPEVNIIEIGSRITKDSCEIEIEYLKNMKLTDTYLMANTNN